MISYSMYKSAADKDKDKGKDKSDSGPGIDPKLIYALLGGGVGAGGGALIGHLIHGKNQTKTQKIMYLLGGLLAGGGAGYALAPAEAGKDLPEDQDTNKGANDPAAIGKGVRAGTTLLGMGIGGKKGFAIGREIDAHWQLEHSLNPLSPTKGDSWSQKLVRDRQMAINRANSGILTLENQLAGMSKTDPAYAALEKQILHEKAVRDSLNPSLGWGTVGGTLAGAAVGGLAGNLLGGLLESGINGITGARDLDNDI